MEIIQPDDFHHHLRDGDVLADVVGHVSRVFARILVMPNLKPPIRNVKEALEYRDRIFSHIPSSRSSKFTPLMSLYLTDRTTSADIIEAKESGVVIACKLYPAGATTNSEYGVTCIENLDEVFQTMAELGIILCIHGEVTDSKVDIFDRERVFIEEVLKPLISRHPKLKIVMEHITTTEAVDFITSSPPNVVATITAHHLLYNRNDIFKGGICPHMYCLPILKRETHRLSLLRAATSGSSKFFCGTDSAPHSRESKESSCGCAGIFTAHAAVEFYAEAFESVGALDKLEGFLSRYGAEFYCLPVNKTTIRLVKEPWTIPDSYPFGKTSVIPLGRQTQLEWKAVAL